MRRLRVAYGGRAGRESRILSVERVMAANTADVVPFSGVFRECDELRLECGHTVYKVRQSGKDERLPGKRCRCQECGS